MWTQHCSMLTIHFDHAKAAKLKKQIQSQNTKERITCEYNNKKLVVKVGVYLLQHTHSLTQRSKISIYSIPMKWIWEILCGNNQLYRNENGLKVTGFCGCCYFWWCSCSLCVDDVWLIYGFCCYLKCGPINDKLHQHQHSNQLASERLNN